MAQYNVQFSIDGRRTQEIVSAYNTNDARKIIEARYTGAKIVIWSVTKLRFVRSTRGRV